MRIFQVFVTMLCGGCVGTLAADPAELVVHEWGTFTTMAGSDGIALSGLHLEEEALPPFVYRQHFGAGKGLNRVTGATVKMETPVQTRYDDSERLHVKNMGTEPIPFAFLFEKDAGDQARIEWLGHLAPGEDRMTGDVHLAGSMKTIEPRLRAIFVHALTEEGLFGDEAEAMIETWWRSYFQRPGLRVFWIVPRMFTDAILPIEIDPAPTDLVRVMVGRSEVLSPAFEHELVETIGTTVNPHVADRFAPAYQARVQALRTAP